MSHTPGPWEYDGKFTVCIPHQEGLTCFRTNMSDAQLIAAAPDMLEALQKFSDMMEPDEGHPLDGALSLALTAIAKATGQEVLQ